MNSDTDKNIYKEEIRKLLRKAEVCRQCHSHLYIKYSRLHKLLHGIVIIFSSLVAILTFADYNNFKIIISNLSKEYFNFSIGVFAFFVFLISLIEEYVNFQGIAQENSNSMDNFTNFIREASVYKNKDFVTNEEYKFILDKYKFINEVSPQIPDKVFIKSKKKLLEKIEISKMIDKYPMKSLREIKKILKKSKDGDKHE